MSLVEMVIALSGIAAILLTAYSVITATAEISDSTKEFSILNRKVHAATERVLGRIYQAQVSGILIDSSGSAMTFQEATDYVDGSLVMGTTSIIEMVSDPNDPFDGIDNDNDGLTDEADIVLRTDYGLPSQKTTVLAQDLQRYLDGETANGLDDNGNGLIDENGLSFELVGRALTIRIGMDLVQHNGNILSRTAETSFTLRN